MNKEIVERIHKLLSLATSDNEYEAKLAAEKANEMLIKHNLRIQDVSTITDYVAESVSERGRTAVEDKWILQILSKHFFVQAVFHRFKHSHTKLFLVGEATNVEVARYVFEYLRREYKLLWLRYAKDNNLAVRYKQSYYEGLTKGLNEQLTVKRVAVEEESKALVIKKDPKIAQKIKEHFGATTSSQHRIGHRNNDVVQDGQTQGRNINISKGITGESKASGKLLK